MVAHVENVNLSAIYGIWLTKCAFFFFPSGPGTVCSVIEVSGRPLLGSRGPHAIQPRPIAAPAGAPWSRRAARAAWCGPIPGPDSCTGLVKNAARIWSRIRRRRRGRVRVRIIAKNAETDQGASSSEEKAADPKGPAAFGNESF